MSNPWLNRIQRSQTSSSPRVMVSPMQQMVNQRNSQRAAAVEGAKPAWQQQIDAKLANGGLIGGGGGGKKDNGLLGTLGTVLGAGLSNPITQTALKPLQVLGYPGRVVQSGLKEAFDVVGLSGDNADGASLADFWSQINDEEFGMGDVFQDTGNQWVDRAFGFAGDVLTDPLTYLSFGAGRFAGAAGKAAAAGQLAMKEAPEHAVRQAARLGVHTLDDEFRQMLNLGEGGLHFAGKRIPGTGELSRQVGTAGSRVSARIGDTRAARAVTDRVGDDKIRDAMRVLQGRAPGDPIVAAARVFANDQVRMGAGAFANQFAQQAKQWDTLGKAEREAVTHAIESGRSPEGAKFFGALFDELQNAGATGVEKRSNYVLHARTPKFKQWAEQSPETAKFLHVDDGESVGRAFARVFEPGGTYTINGQRVTLKDATISEINEKIGGILGFKVLEDDIAKIARYAVGSSAQDAGLAGAIRTLREKFPQLAALEDNVPTQQVFDRAGAQALKDAEVKSLSGVVNDLIAQQRAGVKGVNASTRAAKKAAVDGLQARVEGLRTVKKGIRDEITEAGKAVTAARNARDAIETAFRKPYNSLTREVRALREELRIATNTANATEGWAFRTADDIAAAGVERRVGRRRTIREIEEALTEHEEALADLDALLSGQVVGRGDEATRRALVESTESTLEGAQGRLDDLSGPLGARLEQAGFEDELRRLNTEAVDSAQGAVTDAERRLDDLVEQFEGDRAAAVSAMFAEQGWKLDAEEDLARITEDIQAAIQDRLNAAGIKTGTKEELRQAADELELVARQLDGTPEGDVLQGLLADRAQGLVDLGEIGFNLSNARAMREAAKNGELQQVMKDVMADGWNQIGKELLSGEDATFMVAELRDQFRRFSQFIDDPNWARVMDQYTQAFKTYATMTPGFHVRNGMSASFMNFTEGVGPTEQLKAFKTFKEIRKDPKAWWAKATQPERDAMRAMYGSGAGGSFDPRELGEGVDKITNNFATRLSRLAGEYVEGPARYSLALDTTLKGGSAEEALARVTRIHFDYSQLSQFDRKMKRIIPFWTFMSRNLPLQLQQMWMKPKAYAIYDSFRQNFDVDGPDAIIPRQWREHGAFNTGLTSLGGNPLYLAPDLPHTRLQEEVEKLGDPMKFFSNATPILRVPLELEMNRKMYSGNEFYPDENKLLYALTNMLPGVAQVDRVSGGGVTAAFGQNSDYRQEKQGQSIAGYFGIPARELTPAALDAELRRLAREGK